MFAELNQIHARPKLFAFYTASDLWTDYHTSAQMLQFHLAEDMDVSSRNVDFINRSVAWIAAHFNVTAGVKIADFGCGPGLYANRLAQKQAEMTGIDFSERSIQYARDDAAREGLSVNYVKQDYLDFDTDERFDLILMIMCDYCALSTLQREKMLKKFNSLLKPGGYVLLDVYSLQAFKAKTEIAIYEPNLLDGFWSPNPYFGFLNVFKYESEKVSLDKYTIVEADRIRTVYNWLQYFTPEGLEKEMGASGLHIESIYADVTGSPYDRKSNEFAVVAKKL